MGNFNARGVSTGELQRLAAERFGAMLGPEESRVNKANDHYYYQQTSCVIHPRAISLPQLSAPASNLQASHANQGEDSSHLLPGLRGGEGL